MENLSLTGIKYPVVKTITFEPNRFLSSFGDGNYTSEFIHFYFTATADEVGSIKEACGLSNNQQIHALTVYASISPYEDLTKYRCILTDVELIQANPNHKMSLIISKESNEHDIWKLNMYAAKKAHLEYRSETHWLNFGTQTDVEPPKVTLFLTKEISNDSFDSLLTPQQLENYFRHDKRRLSNSYPQLFSKRSSLLNDEDIKKLENQMVYADYTFPHISDDWGYRDEFTKFGNTGYKEFYYWFGPICLNNKDEKNHDVIVDNRIRILGNVFSISIKDIKFENNELSSEILIESLNSDFYVEFAPIVDSFVADKRLFTEKENDFYGYVGLKVFMTPDNDLTNVFVGTYSQPLNGDIFEFTKQLQESGNLIEAESIYYLSNIGTNPTLTEELLLNENTGSIHINFNENTIDVTPKIKAGSVVGKPEIAETFNNQKDSSNTPRWIRAKYDNNSFILCTNNDNYCSLAFRSDGLLYLQNNTTGLFDKLLTESSRLNPANITQNDSYRFVTKLEKESYNQAVVDIAKIKRENYIVPQDTKQTVTFVCEPNEKNIQQIQIDYLCL